jgi:predicted nucleotidyltransferase
MQLSEAYPTVEHANAARGIVGLFSNNPPIDAILLTNSCARGKATPDSCLDMVVLVNNESMPVQRAALEQEWQEFRENSPAIHALREVGQYSEVHLDFIDGVFTPAEQEEGGSQDPFELEIGNYLVYGLPLWQSGEYLAGLKRKWLPFYADDLRMRRLMMVRHNCLNNLQHIPLYVKRGLYFQSFDRLYNAYRELLQAVFIHRRTYPLSYNKWIREQVEEILGLPQLYEMLSHLFEIRSFESSELVGKAEVVAKLLDDFAPAPERIDVEKFDGRNAGHR